MISLIFGILGSIGGLILSIIEKAENKKRRVFWVIATLICFSYLGKEFSSYVSGEASNRTMNNILAKAHEIDSTANTILKSLTVIENQATREIGIQLRSIEDVDENFKVFEKGDIEVWKEYAIWLDSTKQDKYLKLSMNTGREYRTELILLYLLTNSVNKEKIESVISNWYDFLESDEIQSFETNNPLCDYVIFYGKSGNILGHAQSKELIRDLLMVYYKNQKNAMERSMNEESESFLSFAETNLISFKESISTSSDGLEIAKELIRLKRNESVVSVENKPYLFNILQMISNVDEES